MMRLRPAETAARRLEVTDSGALLPLLPSSVEFWAILRPLHLAYACVLLPGGSPGPGVKRGAAATSAQPGKIPLPSPRQKSPPLVLPSAQPPPLGLNSSGPPPDWGSPTPTGRKRLCQQDDDEDEELLLLAQAQGEYHKSQEARGTAGGDYGGLDEEEVEALLSQAGPQSAPHYKKAVLGAEDLEDLDMDVVLASSDAYGCGQMHRNSKQQQQEEEELHPLLWPVVEVPPVRSVLELEGECMMVTSRGLGETVFCGLRGQRRAKTHAEQAELMAALQGGRQGGGLWSQKVFEALLEEVENHQSQRAIKVCRPAFLCVVRQ